MSLRSSSAPRRFGVVCVLVSLAALAAVGCGNPTKQPAAIAVAYDTLTAYALNQATPYEPTAFYMATNELVVPAGTGGFDIAFNLDNIGNVIVYPAKLILTASGAPNTVGLQLMFVSFNSITIAQHSGYEFNDSLVVAPHETFEVVSQNLTACTAVSITSQELLYGKFIIDSINPDSGQIFFRAVVDPNCDYDTLVPGVVPSH
jgi:hypothetical protein